MCMHIAVHIYIEEVEMDTGRWGEGGSGKPTCHALLIHKS